MEKQIQLFKIIKIPKKDSQHLCLWVTLINFVFITGKNYYPQVHLGECKDVIRKKTDTWSY